VLGFCNVYPFIYSFVADHFQYLASLGIITLIAAGLALALDRWGLWHRPAGYALCLTLLAPLAALTWRQCQVYTDVETLYSATIDGNPTCWMAHNNLGMTLAARGRLDEAIDHYREVLNLRPRCELAYNNLGVALARRGRLDEAIDHYQKALEIRPDYAEAHNNLGNALAKRGQTDDAIDHYQKALKTRPDYASAHNNLGVSLAGRGRLDEAIDHYRSALKIRPDYAEAHNNLGNALAKRGRLDDAIDHYQSALKIRPEYAEAHANLAAAHYRQGRFLDAVEHWRDALRSEPNRIVVLNQLAWVLATCPDASVRNGAEAVELAQRAVQLSNAQQPAVLDTLAAAYAEAGQFPQAVQTVRKALDLATRQNDQVLVKSISAKIAIYEAGAPYRDTPSSPVARPTPP
jgi:protein O-mannosyl-transferase